MLEISRRTLLKGAAFASGSRSRAAHEPVLDPHARLWKHDPEYRFARGARVPDRDGAPEMPVALMKANGIAKTVIIQVIRRRYDNARLAGALKQDPVSLLAVRRVDPLNPAAPAHLSELNVGLLLEKMPEPTVMIDPLEDCPFDQPAELENPTALQRHSNVFAKISRIRPIAKQPGPRLDAQGCAKSRIPRFGPCGPPTGQGLRAVRRTQGRSELFGTTCVSSPLRICAGGSQKRSSASGAFKSDSCAAGGRPGRRLR